MSEKPEGLQNFVLSYWQGRQPLWKVFWLIGGGITIFIRLSTYLASVKNLPLIWWVFMAIIVIPVQIWWMVSVWRCAQNAAQKAWSVLARAVVIFSGISMLGNLVSIFL